MLTDSENTHIFNNCLTIAGISNRILDIIELDEPKSEIAKKVQERVDEAKLCLKRIEIVLEED